ncbi:Mammalian cell entry related domain protein [Oleidesulfovibrio alaskensis G20]|jgi:phospholipid/cholesterol/gamma-HCH transport system substrate-binding protein|uniref:Mammalian cell entry related domain protein n=1 Tax=Oleidesulfovibrio alaskensis (strain ATCC BAA-1058 / DSM 17464 / G20) TaxID=207559 RepID=Q30Z00_OLEA2|nr:outer membrane lipid asymmetry maintenance protein MlaD [Oleidesulfovibrio alaskensis]ABB39096.1 Mammalian cell entry related domain protein [Oleidesulfovibrio alaskensis G20]MBG0772134.1 outer membrane lipid asymmetry maintenance protein MlaD [Oleidesulfovibrio alaskensis]MBL3581314.1 outer membrane lipid asymmetry maintenance protein MlaD [Oleidesulfovibrio alaskensis]
MNKYTKETSVGIFVLIGLLCLGYVTVKLGKMEVFSSEGYTVQARFTSVTGLRVGADVEISGVPVGKVSGINLDQMDNVAVVSLRLRPDVELSEDTIASVKTSGLIGDKYVKLSPGGAMDLLKEGDEILETESALDIEELISKYVFGKV